MFGCTVRPGDMDPRGIGIILGDEDVGFGGDGTIKRKDGGVERNPWYLGTGHQPDHKVDTDPPAASSIGITSYPANGEAYEAGDTITAELTFDESVSPSGDIHLVLDVGGMARRAILRSGADGTFTDSLVFDYTVQEHDQDTDGIGIGANNLKLDGGGIYDSAGNSAGLSHEAVTADPDHKVAGSEK